MSQHELTIPNGVFQLSFGPDQGTWTMLSTTDGVARDTKISAGDTLVITDEQDKLKIYVKNLHGDSQTQGITLSLNKEGEAPYTQTLLYTETKWFEITGLSSTEQTWHLKSGDDPILKITHKPPPPTRGDVLTPQPEAVAGAGSSVVSFGPPPLVSQQMLSLSYIDANTRYYLVGAEDGSVSCKTAASLSKLDLAYWWLVTRDAYDMGQFVLSNMLSFNSLFLNAGDVQSVDLVSSPTNETATGTKWLSTTRNGALILQLALNKTNGPYDYPGSPLWRSSSAKKLIELGVENNAPVLRAAGGGQEWIVGSPLQAFKQLPQWLEPKTTGG